MSYSSAITRRFSALAVTLVAALITSQLREAAYAQFVADSDAVGESGAGASAGMNSVAVGPHAMASASSGIALGYEASADSGNNATALGANARAGGSHTTAVGQGSRASYLASSAFGQGSNANGVAATAVGAAAQAAFFNSTAIGSSAQAMFDGSTAIGGGAVATRANQMMLGSATTTYTTPGITSAASAAAQSGPTRFVTTDADGDLAASDLRVSDIATAEDIASTNEGVSMAMALSGVPSTLPEGADYAISTNWGSFGQENAIAIGGVARLTDNLYFSGGGGIGNGGRNHGGGRAGVTYAW